MFIDSLKTNETKHYRCGQTIGNYLTKHGVPLLSRDGSFMVFPRTKNLEKALSGMPVALRMLAKVGVLNG